MQKLVAATSIAILTPSLYPVLPIASCTRSRASLKLSIEGNQLKKCFWIQFYFSDSEKQPITVKVNAVCRVLSNMQWILFVVASKKTTYPYKQTNKFCTCILPGYIWSESTIFTMVTSMGTMFFSNYSLPFFFQINYILVNIWDKKQCRFQIEQTLLLGAVNSKDSHIMILFMNRLMSD